MNLDNTYSKIYFPDGDVVFYYFDLDGKPEVKIFGKHKVGSKEFEKTLKFYGFRELKVAGSVRESVIMGVGLFVLTLVMVFAIMIVKMMV